MNVIENIVKALDFHTITTMATEGDEGKNNIEHIDDCISKSKTKMSS